MQFTSFGIINQLINFAPTLIILSLQISSITSDNVGVFRSTVNNLSDTMDANIRSMYTIMAKTEEINKKFAEAEEIHKKM